MKAKARYLVAAVAICGIVVAVLVLSRKSGGAETDKSPKQSPVVASQQVAQEAIGVNACDARGSEDPVPAEGATASKRETEEEFVPIVGELDFETFLKALSDESIDSRAKAFKAIDSLSTREKIYWLKHFADSKDEGVRLAAIKTTRLCFGTDAFARKTKTTYKDMQARGEGGASKEGDARVEVDLSVLPTKREAAQINGIVRHAMKDGTEGVRYEAVVAASSMDVETCKALYQYAMMSCSDDVRLAVLKDASYGDDDFLLRLQMAALDVGGEEVVRTASEGIMKATGQQFSNSADAFDWYEKNRTDDETGEIVVGGEGDELELTTEAQ